MTRKRNIDEPPDYHLEAPLTTEALDNMPLYEMGPVIAMADPFDPYIQRLYPNPYNNNLREIGSFKDYLMGHFHNDYIMDITYKLENGLLPFSHRLDTSDNYTEVSVTRAEVERINFYRKTADEVFADIIISTEIHVLDHGARRELRQWYRVRTYSDLKPMYLSFNNLFSISIYDRNEFLPGAPLDEYLVPVTGKDDLDDEAASLLGMYYSEALTRPCRIEGSVLAERMGLRIECLKLSADNSINGQVYFEDSEVIAIDKSGNPYVRAVKANTILIDAESCKNSGGTISQEKLNDAIIHECFHAYKHKLFYLGQKLYNDDLRCLSCSVSGINAGKRIDYAFEILERPLPYSGEIAETTLRSRSPIDWIEWQANKVTPRIRMHSYTTELKINELIRGYNEKYPNMSRPQLIESVISDLSRFYGVSKQSAKLRMIELGYEEARGVLNFANGKYVDNYSFAPGALANDQTYTIGINEALDLFKRSKTFRDILKSGIFQYVDGHYCVADRSYIYRRNGKLRLTPYAKSHMDECCLAFAVHSVERDYEYRAGRLQKEAASSGAVYDYEKKHIEKYDLRAEAQRISKIINELPMSPCGTLKAHMERRNMSVDRLNAKSGVSERTIRRMRTDAEYRPIKTNAIAICFGLQLEPILSHDWLRKVGVVLTNSTEDILLSMLLDSMYKQPLSAVNEVLSASGFSPLSAGTDELED